MRKTVDEGRGEVNTLNPPIVSITNANKIVPRILGIVTFHILDLMIQERMQNQFAKWRKAETDKEKKADYLHLETEYRGSLDLGRRLARTARLR